MLRDACFVFETVQPPVSRDRKVHFKLVVITDLLLISYYT